MENHGDFIKLEAKKQTLDIWKLLNFARGALPISNFRSLGYSILFIRFVQSHVGIHFEASRYDSFFVISGHVKELIKRGVELRLIPIEYESFLSSYLEGTFHRFDDMDKSFVYEAIRDKTINREKKITIATLDMLNQKFLEVEGRSGGEIYSPKDLNSLVSYLSKQYTPKSICDPFAGAGDTAFTLADVMQNDVRVDTQEINKEAHFQIVISRIIRNINGFDYFGDSLLKTIYRTDENCGFLGEKKERKYDLVVTFPPFALKLPKSVRENVTYQTENKWLEIASSLPESRSDWFVVLSMLPALYETGKLITCMTLSALTRGGAEEALRKELISMGIIEQVILLPEKIHYSTSISTVLVILNSGEIKNKDRKVRFVNASLSYKPARGKNILTEDHIHRIVESSQQDGKYSKSISFDEIEALNFNLDPTLYVQKNLTISNITITNFRGYKNFSISMHPSLNVLVGENGAGKTSILEAIACGVGPFLTAMPDTRGKLIRKSDVHVGTKGIADSTRIAIETTSSLSWDLVAKGSSSKALPKIGTSALSNYANQLVARESEYPLIVYYGTSRALTPANSKVSINPFEVEVRGDGYDSALDAKINYGVIKNWFSKIEVDELRQKNERKDHDFIHPAKKLVSETVHLMVKNAVALEFDKVTNDVVVYWKNSLDEKLQLNLEQLSDGYRNIVALTIDLVRRSYLLNPKKSNPLLVRGMVLIDEIELHLHPRWQQKVLGDLINLFPNVQFVVTTHSPQVLTTIDKECIRVVSASNKKAEYIGESTYGAESSRLLVDVLGGTKRPEHLEIIKKLNRYTILVESNQWDSEEAFQLKDELYRWGGSSESELLRLETEVKLREFDRENEEN